MRMIEHPQGSEEWLASRAGIATASCFADIMATIKTGEAASRRNYRAKLVVERLTGKAVRGFTTKAMEQGTEREPAARLAYEAETGASVLQVGLCLHDTLEAGASPDGLIAADGGLELKCPELATHLEYLKLKTEPPEYTWQIQGGMWITGRKWWDFASFNPDFPENLQLVVRRVMRNESAIDKLAGEVARFMDEVRAEEQAMRRLAA
jgi:hypothetical protein